MITDENHPEWQKVRKALAEQIVQLCQREPFDQRLIERLQELCDDCTRKAKAHDLDFPDMVIAYFIGCRQVRAYRRDATNEMIWTYAHNLVKEVPTITPADLAAGLKRAFPKWQPDRKFAKGDLWKN